MAPSLLQISIMMFGVVLPVMLLAEVLRRKGRSQWLAFLAMVPGLNIVLLILIVTGRWPRSGHAKDATRPADTRGQ